MQTVLYERISSLFNGISRQGKSVRYPNQVEDAENVNFSIVDGASLRQGSEIVMSFGPTTGNTVGVNRTIEYRLHAIERDDDEEYALVIGSGIPSSSGLFHPINVNTGEVGEVVYDVGTFPYLTANDATPSDLRFSTIADTTIIVNTKKPTATKTVDGTDGAAIDETTMPVIMERTNATAGSLEFTVSRPTWNERTFYQQILKTTASPTSGTFKLKYEGDTTTQALNWNATAQEVQEALAGNGIDPVDGTADHPAIVGLHALAFGKVQCIGGPFPDKDIVVNISTDLVVDEMIVPRNDSVGVEVDRGSEGNNPAPQFIRDGLTITDVTFHKNRLGLMAGQFVNWSQSNDLYNFFIELADTVVDSDPIEITLGADEISIGTRMVPFRNSVLILTQTGRQFDLTQTGEVFAPGKVALTASTQYATQDVEPLIMGDRLYMLGRHPQYTVVWEYFQIESSVANKAADITKHVYDILPPSCKKIVGAGPLDMLLILPDNDLTYDGNSYISVQTGDWDDPATWDVGGSTPQPWDNVKINSGHVVTFDGYGDDGISIPNKTNDAKTQMFSYRQFSRGDTREQSAWTSWSFGAGLTADNILDVIVMDNVAYLLRREEEQWTDQNKSSLFLEKIRLSDERDIQNDEFPYTPRLDHMVELVGVGSGNVTTWKLKRPRWNGSTIVQEDMKDAGITTGDYCFVLSDNFGNDTGKWFIGDQTLANGDVVSMSQQNGIADAAWIRIDTSNRAGGAGGHFDGYTIMAGRIIDMSIEMGRVFKRDQAGRAIVDGTTWLGKAVVDATESGPFNVRVETQPGLSVQERTVTSLPEGYDSLMEGALSTFTQDFRKVSPSILGTTEKTKVYIEGRSPVPITISALEFHGTHSHHQEMPS